MQLKPFPEYPVLQEHLKLPSVFEHVAFESHGSLRHSFISKEKQISNLTFLHSIF